MKIPKEIINTRSKIDKGNNTNQDEIDVLSKKLLPFQKEFLPNEAKEDLFLVDSLGRFNGLHAPRWLCHLLGLRHKVVHLILSFSNEKLGEMLILQLRDWDKSDSPGHVDLAVGGHITNPNQLSSKEYLHKELKEELGIESKLLMSKSLELISSYSGESRGKNDAFYNVEWVDLYKAQLKSNWTKHFNFIDNEVVGLFLCPKDSAEDFISQNRIPIAPGLKLSLPKYLSAK